MTTPRSGGLPLYEAELKLQGKLVPKKMCRECGNPCEGRRRSWCSDECLHVYRLRTDVGYQRSRVLKRDRGICASCGRDCLAFAKIMRSVRSVPYSSNRLLMEEPDYEPPHWPPYLPALEKVKKAIAAYLSMGFEKAANGHWPHLGRRSWWDMDHNTPLWAGGTNDLTNLRTLCVGCHARTTREGAVDRAKEKSE